jgi:quinol monooxygenase YgiN
MVIVAGPITVEPQQRESDLAGCVRIVEQARRAVGCLDVAICADPVDPGRVNIFERWESQAALETFRSSGPDTEQRYHHNPGLEAWKEAHPDEQAW